MRLPVILTILAILPTATASAQVTDNYARAVTIVGNTYSVPGITVEAPSLNAALNVLNSMAPTSAITPVVPTTIAALDFIRRFTTSEQTTLMTSNPLWALQIAAAGTIDVTNATLIADMNAAVATGLLTQARMSQVLNLAVSSP